MKFSAIPIQAKLIACAGILTVTFIAGYQAATYVKDGEITRMNLAAQRVLTQAETKAREATEKARSLESNASTALNTATQQYEKAQNEKAVSDRHIADLRNDVARLRVSTRPSTPRPAVSGTTACAASGNDETEQTLAGPVAARLAQRYSDYNSLIDQLELCQATVIIDRQMK